ncbi:hypothetical protein TbgDal_IV5280 [Trypanosoma brucei gambiense DAL972]|uniref:Uncharacterized protein n=1 Tax=Trypanosoma brucei gambiense (strain MHOM/CI/86/DAL972) TaxID=679716 RepID=C9ZMF8_TRYB9|nr:hypothetical protein TbgDal_IV5280 [Trypanosoma brucei gambiense DAL972]CBH10832.1 hypothetical protein TbgDal_IV5280 [Trypanosoma brucei gambiense DAL972]|eukprot:XP_011773119.1 hypothetical protein TbgDal_IV5280 [Trypanosoma brucei gambiense DAL972]
MCIIEAPATKHLSHVELVSFPPAYLSFFFLKSCFTTGHCTHAVLHEPQLYFSGLCTLSSAAKTAQTHRWHSRCFCYSCRASFSCLPLRVRWWIRISLPTLPTLPHLKHLHPGAPQSPPNQQVRLLTTIGEVRRGGGDTAFIIVSSFIPFCLRIHVHSWNWCILVFTCVSSCVDGQPGQFLSNKALAPYPVFRLCIINPSVPRAFSLRGTGSGCGRHRVVWQTFCWGSRRGTVCQRSGDSPRAHRETPGRLLGRLFCSQHDGPNATAGMWEPTLV